ncbi:hypothetical protein [Patulibacter minatonensis]|uniref:hypothetical protein n=1 Tax=Patulibacter minatonensis TaxID=298163 RepID=UPI00047AB4C9|nr:hypothetical protein [Patulibacter minatonensis]
MAEAPYQRDWAPIGARHGLRISHATTESASDSWDDVWDVTFTVVAEDGSLVLRHAVPRSLAGEWVAALIAVLDVPAGALPDASTWGAQADALRVHRRQLRALPGTDA